MNKKVKWATWMAVPLNSPYSEFTIFGPRHDKNTLSVIVWSLKYSHFFLVFQIEKWKMLQTTHVVSSWLSEQKYHFPTVSKSSFLRWIPLRRSLYSRDWSLCSEWQYLSIVYEKNSFYSWSVFDNNWLIFSSFIVKIGQFTLEPPAPYRLWYVCVCLVIW